MDPNRDNVDCCANAYDDAMLAYKDYHNMIESYFQKNFISNSKYEQGLVIDLHGQSHPENWIELGYVLSVAELNLNVLTKAQKSSISYLGSISPFDYDNLVRGVASLGGIMQNKFNFKAVPSPANPSPKNKNYFNGGFISQTYGSKYTLANRLNAIQIEMPFAMRDDPVYEGYAKKVAECIFDYYVLHNFDKLNIK